MDIYERLAIELKRNHGMVNGCWQTAYSMIPGLKVGASDTNGTSGIGKYQGYSVYWSFDPGTRQFKVERHNRY